MPGPAFLRSDRTSVELRTVESEDLEFVQRHVNDPDVWPHLGMVAPRNMTDEEEWLESLSENESDVSLLICVDSDPVGHVGLHVNEAWGVGEFGYWIAPDAQGYGYCSEAVRLLAEYAFDQRRLDKVAASAYDYNTGSRRVLEKVGFSQEGVHRKEAYVSGERRDVVRYGLLADELD